MSSDKLHEEPKTSSVSRTDWSEDDHEEYRNNVDFATLSISGADTSNIHSDFGNTDRKSDADDHEHPCVCDLRLPRTSLDSAERYALARNYLRNTSPRKTRFLLERKAKRIPTTPTSVKKYRSSSKKKTGTRSPQRTEKKTISESSQNEDTKSDGKASEKKESSTSQSKKISRSKSTQLLNPAVDSHETVSLRKSNKQRKGNSRIDYRKQPKFAVKMNRAADLRTQIGSVYCGRQLFSKRKLKEKAKKE